MNMPRRIRTPLAILLCAVSLAAAAAPSHRVVMQVSDNSEATWNQAMNNARNVQQMLGRDNVAIEIVVYGHGISMARFDSPVAARVASTAEAGIDVVVCENTMKGQKLTRDDMSDKVKFVPAGVVEIMTRQQEGWAYIKP